MKYLKPLAISIFAILIPIKAALITAFILVCADLIAGIAASIKRGDHITSAGLQRTLVKGMIYEAVIILGFIAEKYLIGDFIPVTKIITSFIGLTELLSIFESLNEISGGSLLKNLITKLQSNNLPKDEDK